MKQTEEEKLLLTILNEAWPGQWVGEFHGIDGRKYRFDAACPKEKVAIEIEGGLWTIGRHNRPVGYLQDMEKYNEAVKNGWRILRYSPEDVRKRPYKLKIDLMVLIGPPVNQNRLDFEQMKIYEQVQVKIS